MHQVEIRIDKTEAMRRLERATLKHGRMLEQPKNAAQVYNLQADREESADNGLMEASFDQWLQKGVVIMDEYLSGTPHYDSSPNDNEFVINLLMPGNWVIHSAPGLKYALLELIHNGMLADWYDDTKPDSATAFKKKAELNKAEIHSIIYSLNPPS